MNAGYFLYEKLQKIWLVYETKVDLSKMTLEVLSKLTRLEIKDIFAKDFLLFWEYEYLQHKRITEVTNNTWKAWNDQKFFISLQLAESWNIRSFSIVLVPFTIIISSYHHLIRSWNIISGKVVIILFIIITRYFYKNRCSLYIHF